MGDDKQGNSSFVFALDRNTGKKLWATKVGDTGGRYPGTRCTPTVDGDLVYAVGQFGDLVCLDAATGKEKWRKNYTNDFYGKGGGLIKIVPGTSGFKAEEVYWKQELNNRHGGVIIVGDYAYGDTDKNGKVWCAEWKNGKVKWKNDERVKGSGSAAIVFADG